MNKLSEVLSFELECVTPVTVEFLPTQVFPIPTKFFPTIRETNSSMSNISSAVLSPSIASTICSDPSATSASTLVLFDDRVDDHNLLSNALLPSAIGQIFSNQQDALAEITELLTVTGATQLAIVAHGEPGVIHLGKQPITIDQLYTHAHLLQEWGIKTIALYSCEVGADPFFLTELAHLTGAEVIATSDKVGATAQGGTWNLHNLLPIFATDVFTTYPHTLAITNYSISGISGTDTFFNAAEAQNLTISGSLTQNGDSSQQALEDALVGIYSSSGTLLYWTIINNTAASPRTDAINFSTSLNLDTALGTYEGGIVVRFWQGTYGSGATNSGNYTGAAKTLPAGSIFDVNPTATVAPAQLTNAIATSTTYTLDTIAPKSPSISLQTDSGTSATDKITKSGVVVVSGLESSARWQYSTDGAANWINGTGNSFTLTGDGVKNVIVRQIDTAGNISASSSLSFTLDTAAPTAPSVVLRSDTGSSSTDTTTNNGAVTVSGLESGARWQYSTNGGTNWINGTGNSFTLTGNGAKNVIVRQIDTAGNISANSLLSFTLDTTATAPRVALTSDTGSSRTDKITNNGGLTISGTETGALVEYSVDGGTTWSNSFVPQEVNNSVQVRQTDIAGNVSAATTLSFTLDT
ncbi:MAG: hypothetical protein B0A82_05520, partial [Alkalinema sp. CACIAM 70d]